MRGRRSADMERYFNEKTGMPGATTAQHDYNGGYNGFWIVVNQKNGNQRAVIKDLESKRTQIILGDKSPNIFNAGVKFQIQLLAPGDLLEVPTWGQINLNENGIWKINGPAIVNITQ